MLTVPTATSVRSVPMKLVIDQRTVINNFLRTSKGGKVSFTHIIGYAMVQALKALPEMNNAYEVVDGKPNLILEGWCATHFNDRTQVSVSFAQKEDRMRTLSATHFVIEQGGYPLKPGQALASHGMDLHVMPVV